MNRGTLSHYGWIVICVLVLATLLAFATPFGTFLADGFSATVASYFYASDGAITDVSESLGVITPLDELQEKHKFKYYSKLYVAVQDINDGKIGKNADVDKENAVAGIYVDRGKKYAVLLKDTTESVRTQPSVDMTINLGGHIYQNTDIIAINCLSGNIIIDGRLKGSSIKMDNQNDAISININQPANVRIEQGTYSSHSDIKTSSLKTKGILYINKATIDNTTDEGIVRGIAIQKEGTAYITECDIKSVSNGETSYAIINQGKTEIKNCNISATSKTFQSSGVANRGTIIAENCTINSKCDTGQSLGIINSDNGFFDKCNITVLSENNIAYGIHNEFVESKDVVLNVENSTIQSYSNQTEGNNSSSGITNSKTETANITNCTVNGFSHFIAGVNKNYNASSAGILNIGELNVTKCNVFGTHAGIHSLGTLNVKGGTYKGIGCGGFYISGNNSVSTIKNSTIAEAEMPEGYINTAKNNHAGFYIGIDSDITVRMNNCNIQSTKKAFVLNGVDKEQNNNLYISNSTINPSTKIYIDSDTHKVYIGMGNNFTSANTNHPNRTVSNSQEYK